MNVSEYSWERVARFKGAAAGREAARTSLASQATRRDFGQSHADFLAKNPQEKALYEAAQAYLMKG